MAVQRFWWRESLLSALSLACNVSRGGRNRFPGAILIIVFSLVISSGSAFADGKADVVAAVNWFLDKLGCDTLGEGLDHRRIPASRVAWADGVHYWWKVLSYLTFVRICSII